MVNENGAGSEVRQKYTSIFRHWEDVLGGIVREHCPKLD